jgi:hypothetical protein
MKKRNLCINLIWLMTVPLMLIAQNAKLEVEDGAVLFRGTTGATPVSGTGTRMMWIPDKAAFRAGNVFGTEWDAGNIGSSSFAGGGINNRASGSASFVGGGFNNTASNVYSFVGGGEINTASGYASFVGGGESNMAPGDFSFIGSGRDNTASGYQSFVGGGQNLMAQSFGETVFGTFNTIYTPESTTEIDTADRLFVIGNGTAANSRRNAVTVMKNGRVGIGRIPQTYRFEVQGDASKSSAGEWQSNSDARLKKNLQPLKSSEMLEKLLALQGISYEWNDDKTGTTRPEGMHYGFTAQNIREVFPTLVREDNTGYLQTAYGTYDAITVEAIRALNDKIESLTTEVENLKGIEIKLAQITSALTGLGVDVELDPRVTSYKERKRK